MTHCQPSQRSCRQAGTVTHCQPSQRSCRHAGIGDTLPALTAVLSPGWYCETLPALTAVLSPGWYCETLPALTAVLSPGWYCETLPALTAVLSPLSKVHCQPDQKANEKLPSPSPELVVLFSFGFPLTSARAVPPSGREKKQTNNGEGGGGSWKRWAHKFHCQIPRGGGGGGGYGYQKRPSSNTINDVVGAPSARQNVPLSKRRPSGDGTDVSSGSAPGTEGQHGTGEGQVTGARGAKAGRQGGKMPASRAQQ